MNQAVGFPNPRKNVLPEKVGLSKGAKELQGQRDLWLRAGAWAGREPVWVCGVPRSLCNSCLLGSICATRRRVQERQEGWAEVLWSQGTLRS